MGKGSMRRPTDEAKFRENWDRIFGAKEIVCESSSKMQTVTAPPDGPGTPSQREPEGGR